MLYALVEERCDDSEAESVSSGGVVSSANAGISSEKTGENPVHRKPKVSQGRLVLLSLVGPKARPYGVVDGSQVEIPEPGVCVEHVGTLSWGLSCSWCHVGATQ